nr:hypothetical protein [Rhodococcus sp. (in: high G+C Gram-positive bacteria)]
MISSLAGTLGIGLLSGLLPFVSIELYLAGIQAAGSGATWYASAVAAALANTAGKVAYYGMGRGTIALPRLRERTSDKPRRGAKWLEKFKESCIRHPRAASVILLISAIGGIPPFGIIAVMAGTANFGMLKFFVIGVLGRTIRLCVVASSYHLFL